MKLDNDELRLAVGLLSKADPDESGVHIILPDDLMIGADTPTLRRSLRALTAALEDASISDAELKGLLNWATSKSWGFQYGRVFTPREFLEELKLAIENYLRRHDGLR